MPELPGITDSFKSNGLTPSGGVPFTYDAAGNVQGILGPNGRISSLDTSLVRKPLQILPTEDVTMWNTDKSAGVTVSVDNAVLFNGRPSIRIDIPAGTSGTIKVGTNVANALVPYNWDKNNFALAVQSTNLAMASSFITYLGDASYTNFITNSNATVGNFPQDNIRNGEWWITKSAASNWATAGGTPVIASQMRAKIQFTATSSASNESIWIGLFGILPPRAKPTIIFTLDDGFSSWYSFIRPLAKYYGLPMSMGIISGAVGTNNYLTQTQILDMFNDESRLFDIVNHSTDNTPYSTLGAAAYYANVNTCRNYLRSIGITGDGPNHHPITQSTWGNDLVDLFTTGGILSSRAASFNPENARDQLIGIDKLRYRLNIASNLQTGKTVTQAVADVQAVVNANGFGMINAHDFKSADGAFIWSYDNMEQFIGQIAAMRDAGTIEVKSWSRWYADATGRLCDRR